MGRRYVSIWFRNLRTDWFTLRQREYVSSLKESTTDLRSIPFVLRSPSHGRMIVSAVNENARKNGITIGMALADARAIHPDLEVLDDKPELTEKLLRKIAEWCIRFTPVVAVDPPDGVLLEVTGCTHLWGGDISYLTEIVSRLYSRGYEVRGAMADTPAVAWGVARYGGENTIVKPGENLDALVLLPPEALRLDPDSIARLHKLGLHQIQQFINIPRSSLRKRFGVQMLSQIDKALGYEMDSIQPIIPAEPFQERLPCLEPIATANGIEIALKQLLEYLCLRLLKEQKGLRSAIFKGYRVDGKVEEISIGTNRPSYNATHLFKLFESKLSSIEPALGIELFILEAPKVEDHVAQQEQMWQDDGGLTDIRLAELMDRLATKVGEHSIHRYVPDEHYWPERSIKLAGLNESLGSYWRTDKLRPIQILAEPEEIEVTAPIPDYPPMLFRYKGAIHKIVRADGPERIEQEWWLRQGQHRDYYRVEDEAGRRYWVFRSGHYHDKNYQWYIHGFFS